MANSRYAKNKDRGNDKESKPFFQPPHNYKSQVDIGSGRNRAYILHSLKLAAYGKVDFSNTEAVKDRIMQYFSLCAEEDMRPSAAGLALCLGCSREYLYALVNGEYRAKKNPELQYMLIQAIQILDAQMVDYMQNNDINPIAGIFLMKNNFGYRDEKNIIMHNNNDAIAGETARDRKLLEQKYAASIADDVTMQKAPSKTETDDERLEQVLNAKHMKPLHAVNLEAEDDTMAGKTVNQPLEAEIIDQNDGENIPTDI